MATINFFKGEQIRYQGSDAAVVSNNYSNHTLTIRLDNGEVVTVDRNDLFGMNKGVTEVIQSTQKHIDKLDEEIAEGEAKIKESNKLWAAAVKNVRKFKNDINTLFSSLGIKSENEITDSKARAEYLALSESESGARKARNRASSDVIWYAHRTFDAILDRHSVELMQSVAENFA